MKRNILIALLLTILLLPSCQKELDIVPNGNLMTPEQVSEGAQISDDRAQAGLPGMYAMHTARELVYSIQGDFGFPSMAARLEHLTDNVVSTTHGYNWFNRELRYVNFQDKNSISAVWSWIASYKNIKLANDLIATSRGVDDPVVKQVLGQALAQRAWNYTFLAQLFQHTYVGHESDLCVPIISDETDPAILSNNPRATVKEVYEFILKDLDDAIESLGDNFKPAVKNQISSGTAYGLRARVHLIMNNWSAAAADAQKAIDVSGATPFTIADCSIPNFDDVQAAQNALWGIIITPEDAVTKSGIANWTSMFTSLCYGYGGYTTMVGTFKMINTRLFDQIPDTDVRKGWWTVPAGSVEFKGKKYPLSMSPLLINAYGKDEAIFLGGQIGASQGNQAIPAYAVVKFAPNEKDPWNKVNAVDFMLMRVEEMYYIVAEAKAMAGDFAGGKAVLENFVKTYRDPQFVSKATNAKELQDEIYLQRRVEFWGEGISFFDMKRLKKGLDRVDVANGLTGGYPELTRFNLPAEDANFVFQIPESEEQANKAIEGKNNPLATPPKDMM